MINLKRVLISCWNKDGLVEFAQALQEWNIEIVSSGGTADHLRRHDVPVTTVESITGYPSILGGRVKTLHPLIHAAILAGGSPEHQEELQQLGVEPFQLVVVNLYPFVNEAVEKGLPLSEAIEYIDIGGPAMLRAAAKNYQQVVPLFHPHQYQPFLNHLKEHQGKVEETFSREYAREAFLYTTWYDSQVYLYFSLEGTAGEELPEALPMVLQKKEDLRYGENPHQPAAVYQPYGENCSGFANLKQLWGKPLSFNNYVDVHAAYSLVLEFKEPAVAIIKHTNPCGAALSDSLTEAYQKALRGDPVSAFGGIVALNQPVDASTAREMVNVFFECIIAPDFEPEALEILKSKKNLRLLTLSPDELQSGELQLKSLSGVYLLQEEDTVQEHRDEWMVVTERQPDSEEWKELDFAWKVCKHVKSNAIVFTRDCEIYGVGAGQMSRVDSVRIAAMKAEQQHRDLKGCVMASDAFFPFRDGIDEAARVGITAVIQPGGSRRDAEVIAAANEHQMSMVFTGKRHFKH